MSQTVFPIIRYRDGVAGLDFLERAFGFERRHVYTDDDGQVVHAELAHGDSLIMVSGGEATDRWAQPPGQAGTYVVVADVDVDAHHARAAEAGAEIVMAPTDQDYGSRDYIARDPEGNLWSFGTYAPS